MCALCQFSAAATADWLVALAAIATAFVAFAALRVAKRQIEAQALSAREIQAQEAYREYLRVCLENPALSSCEMLEKAAKVPVNYKMINHKDHLTELTEKYQWFLSLALNSFEQIICTVPDDVSWRNAIEIQLGYHLPMLCERWKGDERDPDDDGWEPHYGDEMKMIVAAVLAKKPRRADAHG